MGRYYDMLLAHLREDSRPQASGVPAQIELRLQDMVAEGRGAWRDFELEDSTYIRHVGQRLVAEGPIDQELARLCAADLYFACACVAGSEVAIKAFRSAQVSRIRAALGRMGSRAVIEEITQEVLRKLLVGDEARAGAISQYAGRGSIAAWVRVVSLRVAQRIIKRERHIQAERGDQELVNWASAANDPALAELKEKRGVRFKSAFQQAFETLTTRERNILRYQLLHHMNIDEIGALYNVHRSTIARWRAACREALAERTRAILVAELNISTEDLDSLVRLIQSQFDVSLYRLLESSGDAPPGSRNVE